MTKLRAALAFTVLLGNAAVPNRGPRMKWIAIALLAIWPVTASAGEIVDKATKTEEALERGDQAAAYDAWQAAEEAYWQSLDFAVRNVNVVSSAEAIGIYAIRKDNVYRPGESMIVYMEPIGYGFGKDGFGNNQISFAVDVELLAATGTSIFKQENFSEMNLSSRHRNREMFLHIDIDVTGVPTGKYTVKLLVKDKNSGKSAPISLDFEIKA